MEFYRGLFNWWTEPSDGGSKNSFLITRLGEPIAIQTATNNQSNTDALWVPGIRLNQPPEELSKNSDLEFSIIRLDRDDLDGDGSVLVTDPNGTLAYLIS